MRGVFIIDKLDILTIDLFPEALQGGAVELRRSLLMAPMEASFALLAACLRALKDELCC